MNNEEARNSNLREMILRILQAQRLKGAILAGGWLVELNLRKMLDQQGFPISAEELEVFVDYLVEEHAIEKKRLNDEPPYTYKIKLLARGIRHLEGSEHIPGVGVTWGAP